MIDFASSYMTWFGAAGGSISRIDIEAACTLIDASGAEDSFYLIAPCRAEHTHSDGQLHRHAQLRFPRHIRTERVPDHPHPLGQRSGLPGRPGARHDGRPGPSMRRGSTAASGTR